MLDCASSANQPKRKRKLDGNPTKQLLWPLIIVAVVVIADQYTKLWAVTALAGQPPVRVLGDFLMWTLVYNEGGAMGTRVGPSVYYLVMSLVVLPVVCYYIYKNRMVKAVSIPLSLVAAGAIGNLIDRIRLGSVIDFIDVDFFDITIGSFQMDRFWTFNVADSAISCGIVFLLVLMFVQKRSLDPDDLPGAGEKNSSEFAG
jgi:signal peptidase II